MDAAAQRAVRRWDGSPVNDVADEMGTLALDVAGQALFGADLVTQLRHWEGRSPPGNGWPRWQRSFRSRGGRPRVPDRGP
jgi:hypothetical protein